MGVLPAAAGFPGDIHVPPHAICALHSGIRHPGLYSTPRQDQFQVKSAENRSKYAFSLSTNITQSKENTRILHIRKSICLFFLGIGGGNLKPGGMNLSSIMTVWKHITLASRRPP